MEEGEKKVIRRNSGKSFKARVDDRTEKRKQRKEWLKRKREKMRQRQHEPEVEEEQENFEDKAFETQSEHQGSFETLPTYST